MSEIIDWKQKYRDSLQEMETQELSWRQVEQALRRLVGRLCAAGMGVDPRLDDELTALAAANRRQADAIELSRMADALTQALAEVDVRAPLPPQTGVLSAMPAAALDLTRAAVAAMLQSLPGLPDDAREEALRELAGAAVDAKLARSIEQAAVLVHEHGEALARERLQAASVLSAVTQRLEEMARYLTESGDASKTQFKDVHDHNEQVLWQVRELTGEVSGATELVGLQALVSSRLERVTQEVCEFRAREEGRLLEQRTRAQHMDARIASLEREARELQTQLSQERHGARRDVLTGTANRKAFEERFAAEIRRCRLGHGSVFMLLWDIDDFKLINDNYGHRAGDKVLQSVAACFVAAARDGDFVARVGGEEFIMLLKDIPAAQALAAAEQIRGAVETLRFHFRGAPVRVTSSCGLTELRPLDAQESTFDRADAALYQAKHSGKNLCIAA